MVDAEPFLQQFVLRRDHVVIFVLQEMRVHAVAGLAARSFLFVPRVGFLALD
jgi:hypothetical protein